MRLRSLAVSLALTVSLLAVAPAANAACSGEFDVVTSSNIGVAEATMVCLVNEYRENNGRSALTVDSRLSAAARAHSEDMVARNFFDHIAPGGSDPRSRIVGAGYPSDASVGENIGTETGPGTPRSLFDGFRSSPPHNANMLKGDWRAIGVGFAVGAATLGNSGATVTQTFGSADGDGSAGSDTCTRVAALQAKVDRLKRRIRNSSGSKRKKARKALKRVKAKLRAARAECG